MCLKFLFSISALVVTGLFLATITDASFNNERNKPFCMPNKQKANWVAAAKAATVAKPAVGAQTNVGHPAGQHLEVDLSDHAQLAAQTATKVLNGKKDQLQFYIQRLVENQNAINEADRAITLTNIALKRVVWLRESTSHGLQNMMRIYKESNGSEDDIKFLAAFADKEETDKINLLTDAFQRLENLKNSMKRAHLEFKSICHSAKMANNAAEEARQRIFMLRRLVPKIKMLEGPDLQTVKEFLIKHRHSGPHHSS